MRVAMIGWEFPPFSSGGLGTHSFYLTRELSKLMEIVFFMPLTHSRVKCDWMEIARVSESTSESVSFNEFSSYTGWRSEAFSYLKNDSFGNVFEDAYGNDFFKAVSLYNYHAFLKAKELHRNKKFDLIHCHDWITIDAGIMLKHELGLPLVFTVHSTEIDRSANLNPSEWVLEKEKNGFREADVVIAVSEFVKNHLIELGCPKEKIRVVYNAVDYAKFAFIEKQRKGFKKKRKIVLYHGRLSVQKGPDYFLKAAKIIAKKMPEAFFVISGTGDMFKQLVKQSIDLGLSNRVFFLGRISEDELPFIYHLSDVYVLPSVREPFGITVLEAMASGKPVIVSKTSGVSEKVKNLFKVDFWDSELMAEKILFLLKYDSTRENVGAQLKEESKRFTWENVAQETKKVYEEALK